MDKRIQAATADDARLIAAKLRAAGFSARDVGSTVGRWHVVTDADDATIDQAIAAAML